MVLILSKTSLCGVHQGLCWEKQGFIKRYVPLARTSRHSLSLPPHSPFRVKKRLKRFHIIHFQGSKDEAWWYRDGYTRYLHSLHHWTSPSSPQNWRCIFLFFGNDPTAGSPTVTLLRLLLPLNDQVWASSQQSQHLRAATSQSRDLTKPFNR